MRVCLYHVCFYCLASLFVFDSAEIFAQDTNRWKNSCQGKAAKKVLRELRLGLSPKQTEQIGKLAGLEMTYVEKGDGPGQNFRNAQSASKLLMMDREVSRFLFGSKADDLISIYFDKDRRLIEVFCETAYTSLY